MPPHRSAGNFYRLHGARPPIAPAPPACARSSAAPGTSNPAVNASTGLLATIQPRHHRENCKRCRCRRTGTCRMARHCADENRRSAAAPHPAAPAPPLRRYCLRPARRQRGDARPVRQASGHRQCATSRPAARERCLEEMVSAPEQNCICSSSPRAAARTPRVADSPAASSACGSDANATPSSDLRIVQRLDAEGDRASASC